MDGTDVLTIRAYDQTVELGDAGLADEYHEGYSPVYYIGSTRDAVVIRVSGGESSDDSILITGGRTYTFEQETDCDTSFSVGEDGTLEYCRTWIDPSDLEEMGYLTHPHTSAGRVPTADAASAEQIQPVSFYPLFIFSTNLCRKFFFLFLFIADE